MKGGACLSRVAALDVSAPREPFGAHVKDHGKYAMFLRSAVFLGFHFRGQIRIPTEDSGVFFLH